MLTNFKDFLENIIMESLHPEIQDVVRSDQGKVSKQNQIASKIKDLTSRGESTGIEGNMPKGSSRAYLKHAEPHAITLDGQHAHIEHGTKVAIKSALDKYHNKSEYADSYHPNGMSLGQMQNNAENGDHWVNSTYRILHHHGNNNFTSNKESGIFPPLIDHDDKDNWTHVGHAHSLKSDKEFKTLTKTESHPEGISHSDFTNALMRHHENSLGKYHPWSEKKEKELDHIEKHPLVQKFQDYHGNTGNSPVDYNNKGNLGVFHHPDGSKHIVARDHGFDLDTQAAYKAAINKKYSGK